MALQEDNVLYIHIFDHFVVPDSVNGDEVRFGIQSTSTKLPFRKYFFRTRRPIEEYRDLCEYLASRYPNILLPALPFEQALPDENEDELDSKKAQLHVFFQDLIQIPDVFNDPIMPLFVQTNMTMEQIKEQLAKQEADSSVNEEQVEESNDQQVAAGNANDQQVAANNQQVLGNRVDDQPSDGENAARGNASESETDEPIFPMDDI